MADLLFLVTALGTIYSDTVSLKVRHLLMLFHNPIALCSKSSLSPLLTKAFAYSYIVRLAYLNNNIRFLFFKSKNEFFKIQKSISY